MVNGLVHCQVFFLLYDAVGLTQATRPSLAAPWILTVAVFSLLGLVFVFCSPGSWCFVDTGHEDSRLSDSSFERGVNQNAVPVRKNSYAKRGTAVFSNGEFSLYLPFGAG